MRAIFAVLVLINGALFAYHWWAPAPEEAASGAPKALNANVPKLQLLKEAPERSVGSPPEVGAAEPSNRQPLCEWVGPFGERARAEALEQRLKALDVAADIRELEVSDGLGFWVHLPPELSQKAALQKLHELQAKQIDSYVIPRGELENGISFGMFSREALAQARRDDLIAQGYGAEILEVERTHQEIWLSMPAKQAQALSPELWDELLASPSNLDRQQNFCSGVASGEKFL